MIDDLIESSSVTSAQVFSVSQITAEIKALLAGAFPAVWIEGEISNFKHHTSGHMYFTLKDEGAELKAVMFRGHNRYLRFTPEDGMKVLAQGDISVYEARGVYQLVVRQMEPAGLGTLYLAFEALKKKLAEEGLFDDERKQPLPSFPFSVGVVTSGSGAAVEDIKNVLLRRSPHVEVIIRPTKVQGEEAADDIVAAVRQLTVSAGVDVLIVGRGGGSMEDLWSFNEEKVARALADCPIPVISAVGHETDFTIADFVADLRAPTPSAAAELVSPSKKEIISFLDETGRRSREAMRSRLHTLWQQLDAVTSRYGFQQPGVLIDQKRQRLGEMSDRLSQQIQFVLSMEQSRFQGMSERLLAVSPRSVLARGYSVAYKLPQKQVVNKVESFEIGEKFGLLMSDGEIEADVKKIKSDGPDSS
tara:strand:+ start:5861 stop:7111 length:1251 start_codon:yes stop_codon:yes gene_type:complete